MIKHFFTRFAKAELYLIDSFKDDSLEQTYLQGPYDTFCVSVESVQEFQLNVFGLSQNHTNVVYFF